MCSRGRADLLAWGVSKALQAGPVARCWNRTRVARARDRSRPARDDCDPIEQPGDIPRILPGHNIVEAFPNAFLGVLLTDADYADRPKLQRGGKFDWLYDRCVDKGLFEILTDRAGLPRDVSIVCNHERDHECRAALVCLLTAALTHSGTFEAIGRSFQAANPDVQVALEVQSWDNINDVVRTKVQANQAPDILNIDAYSGFAQDDLLYPATEIASPETIADLQPSFVQNATLDGTQQAMPLIASTRTLFYNTDLFAQAGIAAPPKTWAELQAAAEKIQALGLPDTYGYGMPLGSEEAQAETSIWTFGAGGSWGDAPTLTIDTPQNLEGLQAMRQLIDAKATQPDPGADRPHPADQRVHPGQAGHDRGPAADRRPDQGEEPGPDLRHRADPDQGRHAGHPRAWPTT